MKHIDTTFTKIKKIKSLAKKIKKEKSMQLCIALNEASLTQLKIDQSFVRDIVSDTSDKAIVRTIIAMAKSMAKTFDERSLMPTKYQINTFNNFG